jgi:hypothetical protein
MKDPVKMIEEANKNGIPTFTIKATDVHAHSAMFNYLMNIIEDSNVSLDFLSEIIVIYRAFNIWKEENEEKVKVPTI